MRSRTHSPGRQQGGEWIARSYHRRELHGPLTRRVPGSKGVLKTSAARVHTHVLVLPYSYSTDALGISFFLSWHQLTFIPSSSGYFLQCVSSALSLMSIFCIWLIMASLSALSSMAFCELQLRRKCSQLPPSFWYSSFQKELQCLISYLR